ncbi:MAG: sigma 54-interacting transcriptional regulator [Firmicutes bacterium]|nr:sigma 54-interacting transcriptional regulator [Bacillota bacterium]
MEKFFKAIPAYAILEPLADNIGCGIHVIDVNAYTVFYNKKAAELDGLSPNKVIGKYLLDSFPSLTEESSTLIQAVKTGKSIFNMEQHFTNCKGVLVSTVNTTVPIYHEGNIIGAMEISQDVRKHKILADEIVRLERELYNKAKTLNSSFPNSAESRAKNARYTLDNFIGKHPKIIELKNRAYRAAQSSSPICVYGETGTGKEILVQGIHNASMRRDKPFIAQNCAALPESLLEGILFGTFHGAFTGAKNRPGLFELANEGTIYLDELDSLNPGLQAKLLRVLQEKKVCRLGGQKEKYIDLRIITSISTNPLEALEKGKLRKDLFYRISVINLGIPPLRQRKEDITLLVEHFLQKQAVRRKHKFELSAEVMNAFYEYPWPGNVRELEHAIEGATEVATSSLITMDLLPPQILLYFDYYKSSKVSNKYASRNKNLPLRKAIKEFERELILESLQESGGNISRAARLLQIPRQTLQYKIKSIL